MITTKVHLVAVRLAYWLVQQECRDHFVVLMMIEIDSQLTIPEIENRAVSLVWRQNYTHDPDDLTYCDVTIIHPDLEIVGPPMQPKIIKCTQ